MKKVVMIVDNPKRDLAGLSLIAYNLVLKGNISVYLVPMYEQHLHILDINPDLILLNYCRPANSNKIKVYSKLGAKIGVLDTEGGIRREHSEFYKGLEATDSSTLIDIYLTWGKIQEKVIRQFYFQKKAKTQVICTGSPRYDFLSKSYQNFLSLNIDSTDNILILASFTLCNPKFATVEQEAKNMVDALGYSMDKLKIMQSRYLERMHNYINLIKKILTLYPHKKFVFRAHPFENDLIYKENFKNYNNIVFNDSGEIFQVIHKAKIVILINSAISIEAAMIGKPVIQPQYLNHEEDESKLFSNACYLPQNEKDFIDLFHSFLNSEINGLMTERNYEITKHVNEIMNEYFYKIDGKSSERVANEIYKILINCETKLKINKSRVFKEYFTMFIKNFIKSVIRKDFILNKKSKAIDSELLENLIKFHNSDKTIKVHEKSFYWGNFSSTRIKVVSNKEESNAI